MLNVSKTAGPDGIHVKIIKEYLLIFAHISNIIFHKSLKEGVFPNQGKLANVKAIY